ncbi:hypothetical protein [Algoriphagus aquimarinus]|uniref:Uncharacterized protein n=1 Tax=Algoriphagus aquimarinus TaxID=237018 RepID=A0A1I1BAW0_9BACT|nr:hypothetical protein [Algoriphagus aquimarinus]SFB47494.1 hypothetical protein SAMN04489723_11254 [Algoriphagus aquimarinus]
MKDPDITILSQIQKAHSIGSVVTLISFALNVFASRIKELEFLIIPLIIIVSLTIIASAYFLFQSVKHKEGIEKPVKNNTAFIFRIGINLVLLALMLL